MEYSNELSQAAQRLAEIIKAKPPTGQSLHLVSGDVVSVGADSSTAMIDTGEAKIQAINKSGDKLTVGESVWLGYIKSLADAVILFRAGLSKPGGVGEDLGNGNERFNDYTGNTVDFDTGSEGEYNTLKGHGNTIVGEADGNMIGGNTNRIAVGDNNTVSGNGNRIIGTNGNNNAVSGERNTVMNDGNSVSGINNAAGMYPTVPLGSLPSTISQYYDGTAAEKAGTTPGFIVSQNTAYKGSSVVGEYNTVGEESTAIGSRNIAKRRSVAAGYMNVAAEHSAAIGQYCAAWDHSIAVGENCSAGTRYAPSGNADPSLNIPPYGLISSLESMSLGTCSGAFGYNVKNDSSYTYAFGKDITADHQTDYTFIAGEGLIAQGMKHGAVFGKWNSAANSKSFVIGNGTASYARSNSLEFDGNMYIQGSYQTLGADYAEYEEWLDGNPENEDRTGHFVTYEGDKIRYASADDDYILGVVSATPSIIGDSDISYWHGRFKRDIFGRMKLDKKGNPIASKDYDPEMKYTPRAQRPEWAAIGTHGKLIVIDDGSCVENGYCRPTDGGIATRAMTQNGAYRVLKRLDDKHIKIRLK